MNKYRKLEMQAITNMRMEEYKYFVGTTLKNPLEYKIGETMTFRIRVKHKDFYLDIPYIRYTLTSDDGQKFEEYKQPSDDGWFYIDASISKNGFVYVQAQACDENKQPIDGIALFNGSAGADVSDILRATKTPDDYLEFWDMLKGEVDKCEPEVIYCKEIKKDEYPNFEFYDMRIKAPWSDFASVAVAYPRGAEKGSLKLAMTYQGYGVRSANFHPMDGYMTVEVNAHAIPNLRDEAFYAELRDVKMVGYGYDAVENEKPETTYWAKMILRDLAALRFFENHELLNKKDYYFVGSSQGGMQACNMAAHFDKASAVILNVPWLSDIYGNEICGRRENKMPKGFGVTYFDTAVAAQYLRCSAYIISGLGDVTCNASTQMALFNSIRSPKYIEFYQNKVHSFTIPWDKNMYALGDMSLADEYSEHTAQYYSYN